MQLDPISFTGLAISALALLGTIVNSWIVVRIHIAALKSRQDNLEADHHELKKDVKDMANLMRNVETTLAGLNATLKAMRENR